MSSIPSSLNYPESTNRLPSYLESDLRHPQIIEDGATSGSTPRGIFGVTSFRTPGISNPYSELLPSFTFHSENRDFDSRYSPYSHRAPSSHPDHPDKTDSEPEIPSDVYARPATAHSAGSTKRSPTYSPISLLERKAALNRYTLQQEQQSLHTTQGVLSDLGMGMSNLAVMVGMNRPTGTFAEGPRDEAASLAISLVCDC